ncbi:sodium channel and clathrin linker 1-like [Antedon mediterranea]|uniref:sodium channel and clathrin linker 1-like n=1 Tax=Antedon mediterranea TaxID=105859 RepID=UPI003AF70B22
MVDGEIEFLRDQVQRLSAELRKYQEKYLPLDEQAKRDLQDEDSTSAPWLINKGLLSPLVAEYDKEVHRLRQEIHGYKIQHHELSEKCQRLVDENNKLRSELKNNIQTDLESSLAVDDNDRDIDNDVINNLQRQLQVMQKEKDYGTEMWQATQHELEILTEEHKRVLQEAELHSQTHQAIQEKGTELIGENQQLQTKTQRLEMTTSHLQQVISSQNEEIESLRTQLTKARNDFKTSSIQLKDMKTTLESLQDQIKKKNTEVTQAVGKEKASDNRLMELQTALQEYDHRMSLLTKENKNLKSVRDETEENYGLLLKRCSDAEKREREATMQVKDSIQLVENMVLEKDQAVVREQQCREKLERLQESLTRLVNEAGKRTRQEVDNVRKQCNINIAKLMEELQSLETENGEKQAEIERAMREKRAVEEELQKMYKEGMTESNNELNQKLQMRALNAERLRIESETLAKSLDTNLQQQKLRHDHEQSQLILNNTQLQKRLAALSKECETMSEERLMLSEEVDNYKKRVTETKKEQDATERMCQKETSGMEHEMNQLRREYEIRFETLEDTNRQAMFELRQMLTSQQRISAKWREESKSLAQKFESKVKELRLENSTQKQRCKELTLQLTNSRETFLEAEHKLAELSDINKKLHQKITDSENRVADSSKKVSEHMARERRILQEKTYLQRELDKFKLENSRTSRLPEFVRNTQNDAAFDLGLSRRYKGSATSVGSARSSVGSGRSTPEFAL